MILTESKSFGAARLQNERGGSHEGEERARYDKVHDVIARLASKMESETDPGKWRFTAFIYRQRFVDWNICRTDVQHVIRYNWQQLPFWRWSANDDYAKGTLVITVEMRKRNKCSAVADMGDRGHNRHGPERGEELLCPFCGGSWPRLTQCGLGRGLLPYQVASSFIQPFATIDMGQKLGSCAPFRGKLGPHRTQSRLDRGLPPYQVAS